MIHELRELMYPHHRRWRSICRPSLSATSETRIACGKSCLLAKTSTVISCSSACKEGEKLVTKTAVVYWYRVWLFLRERRVFDNSSLIKLKIQKLSQTHKIINLTHNLMQFISCFRYSSSIIAVYYKNESLDISEVMSPQRPNLSSSSDPKLVDIHSK